MHISSGNHKKAVAAAEAWRERNPGGNKNSLKFEKEFSYLFKSKYGYNKYIPINKVYNDLIHDRHHTHLSATDWRGNLSKFALYLHNSCENEGNETEIQSKDDADQEGKIYNSEDLVQNKLGLVWRVMRDVRHYQRQGQDSIGSIDEIKIMLIDY